jgi:RNA polymerase sigma-70 factor (ECF subfamily)
VAYRVAFHFTRESPDAEDLVQEAALLACRNRGSFRPGSNFRVWFLRIRTNVFYSKCRQAITHRESVSLQAIPEVRLYLLAGALGIGRESDVAQALLDRIDAEVIRQALSSLPPEYRTASTMYLVDDFSYQEIAQPLACRWARSAPGCIAAAPGSAWRCGRPRWTAVAPAGAP